MINYIAEDIKMPQLPKRTISAWIKQVVNNNGFKVGDISYIFCSDEKILEVNKEYLQHDYYTDIITFDYTEENVINGDIFVSLDTVKSNAEQFSVSFEKELRRVLIHGILHLCGQADKSTSEKAEMTRKEDEALLLLNGL
jgi:probable rRNA maturation factor